MKKKIKDLTPEDIGNTCKKYSLNDFTKCSKDCPLYCKNNKNFKCKTSNAYMKRYGEEEVEVDKY